MLSLNKTRKSFGEYKLFEEVFKEDGDKIKVYGIEFCDSQGNSVCRVKAVSALLDEMNRLLDYLSEFRVPQAHFFDILEDFVSEKHEI